MNARRCFPTTPIRAAHTREASPFASNVLFAIHARTCRYLENRLYFTRLGSIESGPKRRTLSSS